MIKIFTIEIQKHYNGYTKTLQSKYENLLLTIYKLYLIELDLMSLWRLEKNFFKIF